jgi:hypothetical protein
MSTVRAASKPTAAKTICLGQSVPMGVRVRPTILTGGVQNIRARR